MKVTRRKFIGAAPVVAGAMLGLSAAASGQAGADIAADAGAAAQLSVMSWNAFYPFQNTEFTFAGNKALVSMTLNAMDQLNSPKSKAGWGTPDCFMLKFAAPANTKLKQGTYDVNHFSLGDFRLFITEGSVTGRRKYYIAVVNHMAG